MATRNRPSLPPTKRPSPSSVRSRGVPPASGKTRATRGLGNLPIEGHRALASLVLALMVLLTLFAPLSRPGADPTFFLTPRIDGSGSVVQAQGSHDLLRSIFSYSTFVERSQQSTNTTWPEVTAALRFDPSDIRSRQAIIGHIYASTSGNLNIRLKDSGMESRPSPIKIDEFEQAYREFLEVDERGGTGANGLSAMALVRSLSAVGEERRRLELLALDGFREAINANVDIWQYTHNWALANLLAGNYSQALEGMRVVSNRAETESDVLPSFWSGLAALRVGDPGEAIQIFTPLTTRQAPSGGNDAFNELFVTLRTISREGLADARWANRAPSGAYSTYFDTLLLGEIDPTLYHKWLRLGLQMGAYEKLAADMSTLITSSDFRDDPRVHHDRARLLDLLGRGTEAESVYKEALRLESDPGLLIAYGQSLLSRGDHSGALSQATEAIRKLNEDPETADLSSVARAATTSSTLVDVSTAQQLLDANLLRARAWGGQGNTGAVESLAQRIVLNAEGLSPDQVALLHLYAGFAYEATGLSDAALTSYRAAWDTLKAARPGTGGRGAALAGMARATTLDGNVADGIQVLRDNGFDPAAPAKSVISDPDAPELMLQGGMLLRESGQLDEAANAMRVASILSNLRDVRASSGIGRPVWSANGTSTPSGLALQAATAAREGNDPLVTTRYRQALALDPALAPAWNNLGVYHAQNGNVDLGRFYLQSSAAISPSYAWGQQNLAALGYKQGFGNFFAAEDAQGDAIKSVGPQALSWGHQLRYDERGTVPAPALPPTNFLERVPALLLLLLLLLHTLIGGDRLTNRMGVLPARSLLGKLGLLVDTQAKTTVPALITPRSDTRSLLIALAIPSVIGMLALAWGTSGGSLEVFMLYLPVALLASVIAFGGNELAQRLAARARHSYTMHHNWVLGIILGIVSIPFGFVYGWQTVTRVQPVSGSDRGDGAHSGKARATRTTDERDLLEEAQIEAAADEGSSEAVTLGIAGGIKMPSRSWIGGSPAVSIMAAGLALNLAIGLLAGSIYWLTGWPSMRIITFASILVLAFTSVSDPPADGWTLYRRNPPLWLALFVFAAVLATLLALKMI